MKLELKEGEVICPECKGGTAKNRHWTWWCYKCHGSGKLDWIERIVGKKPIQIWSKWKE